MPFQVGDVVQLNSGGPFMTVTVVEASSKGPKLHCVWFYDNRQDNGVFPEATVKLFPEAAVRSKAEIAAELEDW